jgi:hypothetical protein
MGTNQIVGTDTQRIVNAAIAALTAPRDQSPARIPPLWDGHTSDRILDALGEA